MDKNIFNGNAEGRILDHLGDAIKKTKHEMEPILNERANGELLNNIKNPFVGTNDNDLGNTTTNINTNSFVRVKKAPVSPRVGNSSQSSSYTEERPMNREFKEIGTPVYEENDPFTNRGSVNYSTILIVIAALLL